MPRGLYIKTYGCQMNVYDSAMMEEILKGIGYKTVSNLEEADLILLNTCHIREKAAEKMYSDLGRIKIATSDRDVITVVAGCVAQAEGEIIMERASNVDIVIGPQTIHTLPEMIAKVERKMGKQSALEFSMDTKFDYMPEEKLVKTGDISAFVSVQEGCDKFCTFCCVPYTRGAEYSRSVSEVYREVMRLVHSGIKEVTLLGQNVSAYHGKIDKDSNEEMDLGSLLQHIASISNLERIRYITSHPRDMHDSLYEAHKHPKIMPFKHLPVQSGADAVLKAMNRKHSSSEYLEVIQKLREARSDIQFSSDFIVGFPGETDRDFQQTMDLVEKVGFAQAYSFKYSPRPGTPGAAMLNQIDEKVKSKRLAELQELLESQKVAFNKSMETIETEVLFDNKSAKYDNQVLGKTPYLQTLYVEGDNVSDLFGKIRKVKVIKANKNSLQGELLSVDA